jgi:hypothetical protein
MICVQCGKEVIEAVGRDLPWWADFGMRFWFVMGVLIVGNSSMLCENHKDTI